MSETRDNASSAIVVGILIGFNFRFWRDDRAATTSGDLGEPSSSAGDVYSPEDLAHMPPRDPEPRR